MGIYLSYILYGDFSHTFCMGISLIHFVWDSTFFLLKSGPSSGTGKAPIAEGRALLEVEVLYSSATGAEPALRSGTERVSSR